MDLRDQLVGERPAARPSQNAVHGNPIPRCSPHDELDQRRIRDRQADRRGHRAWAQGGIGQRPLNEVQVAAHHSQVQGDVACVIPADVQRTANSGVLALRQRQGVLGQSAHPARERQGFELVQEGC
ncbi:hypothetical protein AB0L13_39415 [Saccharopolyspora shandongensis]|uniref:hypothetical protein n=1 Tax=Saccharopolyspora shandongensis TaxID=418495 RepID=UPI00342AFC6A